VEQLRDAIGIPSRIRDLGGTEDQLAEFAGKAFSIKRLMVLTPRPVSEADILAIYREAL
jgi:alcohol dehydrogenase class IV